MSKKNRNKPHQHQVNDKPSVTETPTKLIVEPVEVYQPSQNSEKYPEKKETGKFKYKVLTYRNDHVRLQEEVSDHLNDGWELVGGISTAFHADAYSTLNMFSQALVKRF